MLLSLLVILISCAHDPKPVVSTSPQRCVADSISCNAVLSSPEPFSTLQTKVKDALIGVLNDDRRWPQIIRTLDALMPEVAKLSEENKLKPVLMFIAGKALEMGKLPARITKENLPESIDLLVSMIENQFIAKGMSSKNPQSYVSWLEASRRLERAALKTEVPARGPEGPLVLTDPRFVKELETAAESSFRPTEKLQLLVDGPASFPVRKKLIEDAKESVYVMSWAFEGDVTGWMFAKLLAAKHAAGVDVRIIVDNKTAQQGIYGEVPAWLKAQGVPIIQWQNASTPMYAFHKKILVVDGQQVVAGGMNFGDVYSHMGPEKTPKWRDTDFLGTGNVAVDSLNVFINNWNSQVDVNRLPLPKISPSPKKLSEPKSPSDPQVMVIDQIPNTAAKDVILASIMKGIEGATKEINIENAYFIQSPAVNRALIRALKRGVKVRIFTNSTESIDVPIIAKPILESLQDLYKNGAAVFLKKGPTLHSKFMTVDEVASWVMSYNHHPQSMRIQGEDAFVVLDPQFSQALAAQFRVDTQSIATPVTDAAQLQPKRTILDAILQHYFFDQL